MLYENPRILSILRGLAPHRKTFFLNHINPDLRFNFLKCHHRRFQLINLLGLAVFTITACDLCLQSLIMRIK